MKFCMRLKIKQDWLEFGATSSDAGTTALIYYENLCQKRLLVCLGIDRSNY